MSRYIKDIKLEQPIDVVSMVMDDFIYHNHFTRTDWNGEMVFYLKDSHKKERYMKWTYVDGQFHVEAWLKTSFGGEMDLNGVGGGASRKEFRASMDRLIETLKKTAAGSLAGGHVGSDPIHHDNGHAANHDTWRADTQWQQGGQNRTQPAGQRNLGQPQGSNPQPAAQRNPAQPQGSNSQPAGQRNAGQFQGGIAQSVQDEGSRRGTVADPDANKSTIFAVLALFFGWSPILCIVNIWAANKYMSYSSKPKLVKTLCIIAVVEMILVFAFSFMLGFLGN